MVWCMVPLAPTVMTIRGATIQPWFYMSPSSMDHFFLFSSTFLVGILLLQYVNSRNSHSYVWYWL
jgi:hypothetical protein